MYLYPICQRTKNYLYFSKKSVIPHGGGERARTDGLLRAKQALSQLSYTPIVKFQLSDLNSWWAWMDLNHRPHAYQACALTETELQALI